MEIMIQKGGPNYTSRMFLTGVIPSSTESSRTIDQLNKFSHFTLACTDVDNAYEIGLAFEKITTALQNPVLLKAIESINLGSSDKPLWAIRIGLGKNEAEFRKFMGELFDGIMCPERNGILYTWRQQEGSSLKTPHVTLGSTDRDKLLSEQLVGCGLVFGRMDYKKVGPNDPHVSKSFSSSQAACEPNFSR